MSDTDKYRIVMARNGLSEWTAQNYLCGWFDSDLSEVGYAEAVTAGRVLKDEGYEFDIAFSSVLRRANLTLKSILKELAQPGVPVIKTWKLNERHYGGLTGLNKTETGPKHGELQVQLWRRTFDFPPPPMEEDHPFFETITKDPRYADLAPEEFPRAESLKQCMDRAYVYWEDVIVPQIKEGKRVIIVAHGGSLKGIIKQLEDCSYEDVMTHRIPTSIPFVYELDEELKPTGPVTFLGDREMVQKVLDSGDVMGTDK